MLANDFTPYDPAREALRAAYIAILSWPIKKQTAEPVTTSAGETGAAASVPQLEEQEQNDYIPGTSKNTEFEDLLDGTKRSSLEPSSSGPKITTKSGGEARSSGAGVGFIAPDSLAQTGGMDGA